MIKFPKMAAGRLSELLGEHRGRLGWVLALFSFKASPMWLTPFVTGRMIDQALSEEPGRMKVLGVWTALLVGLWILNVPGHVAYVRNMSLVSRSLGRDLRIRICRQLQVLTLHYHNTTSVGRLQTKAIRDIEIIEAAPRMVVELVFQFLAQVGIAVGAIAWRAPKALVFFAVAVPVAAVVQQVFRKRMNQRVEHYRKSVEGMSAALGDMMTMIPVTRAHGLEEEELRGVERSICNVYDQGMRFDMLAALFGSLSYASMCILQILFLTGSVVVCMRGGISVGDVVMFNSLFLILSNYLAGLLNAMPQLSQTRESFLSVLEVLDAPELEHNSGKPAFSEIKGAFDFMGVNYQYPATDRPALERLDLRVQAGQTVAFIGPSGSGKSTLLGLLLGFLRPGQGRVLLDGRDMGSMDLRSFRRHVGVVTQTTVFFSGTVFENVAYGVPDVTREQVIEALRLANAWEFVQALPQGLDARLGEGGLKLSGGQQQRLAIARAIIRDPRVLILDEATSALDAESEAMVQVALDRIMRGRTTFIVAHRMGTVRSADRIVILEEGRITAAGSPQDLAGGENFYARCLREAQVQTQPA